MKILVLNLTRLGDLLQSQAGINDLTTSGHEVALVSLANFADAAKLLRGVTCSFSFEGSQYLKKILESNPAIVETSELDSLLLSSHTLEWVKALKQLVDWRSSILHDFDYDSIINLTPTISARLLTRFLKERGDGKEIAISGFCVDSNGFSTNKGKWTALLQGTQKLRASSPFNVVDIFRMVMTPFNTHHQSIQAMPGIRGDSGLKDPPCEGLNTSSRLFSPFNGSKEALSDLLVLNGGNVQECQGFIGLQLGASELRRQWPVEYFAAVGDWCWNTFRYAPVLFGSPTEVPLSEMYAKYARSPFISLTGKTDLSTLANALKRCSFLVTNDTGTMHLAAGLHVPIIGIFLSTAQPFDTGPYAENSITLEPDMPCHPCAFGQACPRDFSCRFAIKPEDVISAVRQRMQGQQQFTPDTAISFGMVRVWRSFFDTWGMIWLQSVNGHGDDERTTWLNIQRRLLGVLLGLDSLALDDLAFSSMSEMNKKQIYSECSALCGLLDIFTLQAKLLTLKPSEVSRQKFMVTWNKIYEALTTSRWLAAFAPFWMEDTQTGADILETLGDTMALYRSCFEALAQHCEPDV